MALLIFANKQDLPNAMSAAVLEEKLSLKPFTRCAVRWTSLFVGEYLTGGNIPYELLLRSPN